MVNYFFDSYAIAEILDGNPNYKKYSDIPFVMTIFNLAEIYWFAIREYGEKKADIIYEDYRTFVVDIDDETLKKAMQFRVRNKRKNLSYADCIGYIYAIRRGFVFLTGDKEFKNMKGVEFVK